MIVPRAIFGLPVCFALLRCIPQSALTPSVAPEPTTSPAGRADSAVAAMPTSPAPAPATAPAASTPQSSAASHVVEAPSPPEGVGAAPAEKAKLLERHPFHEALPQALAADTPAMRFSTLSPSACRALAKREELPVKRDRRPTPGVATAFRFTGPLRGIRFLTAGYKSPFGVMDCRLVFALDAMAELLIRHGVTEVHVGTIYRRNSRLRGKNLSQHAHGLAADIVAFKLEDGRMLSIEQHFAGQMGAPVCGPESGVEPASDEAVRLRNLVCDLARSGVFHYMLTPNYDRAHHDHMHVDIKRNAKRTVIR